MNYNGSFNPRFLSGTQLYFAKNTATVSSWNDQSPNGFNLTQAVALQQPTIGTNSVDFVPNKFMSRTVANAFSGDNSGIIFFNGIYNSSGGIDNIIFASSATSNNNHFFYIRITTSGKLGVVVRTASGANIDVLEGDTILTNGQSYHGWAMTNGSVWTAKLNGTNQTITATNGSNSGKFFSSIPNRANISVGASIRNVSLFGNLGLNKLYYNNTALSASDLWKTEQFFANPLNYD
jgi:hypothetical protein